MFSASRHNKTAVSLKMETIPHFILITLNTLLTYIESETNLVNLDKALKNVYEYSKFPRRHEFNSLVTVFYMLIPIPTSYKLLQRYRTK